jgi:hypothetical protein
MKFLKTMAFVAFASIAAMSCKKDKPEQTDSNPAAEKTIKIPSDADGAFYGIISRYYANHNTSALLFEESQAYAWVGDYVQTKDAGVIKLNDSEISLVTTGNYGWYFDFFGSYFDYTESAKWDISGNSATGIAPFTYTDNTPFPKQGYFTVPASIGANSDLTVTHNAVTGNNVVGIVYTIAGDVTSKSFGVPGNLSTSYTFKNADIKAVSSDGNLSVSVMPAVYTTSTIGGKKYYFIKQFQHVRETELR